MALDNDSIFDLYFGIGLKDKNKQSYFDVLITQKKTSLHDIDFGQLKIRKADWGTEGNDKGYS